jgi:hypothetical protein
MTKQADPAKIRKHLTVRRVDDRVLYDGEPTEYTAGRNGNEPASSPLAWNLKRDDEIQSIEEANTRGQLLDHLAKIFAGKCDPTPR